MKPTAEEKTVEKLRRKPDIRTAIMVAADSPELVRPIDAWRVYDFALSKGVVSEVKFVLRVLNPHTFRALCQYEGEEIEHLLSLPQNVRVSGAAVSRPLDPLVS